MPEREPPARLPPRFRETGAWPGSERHINSLAPPPRCAQALWQQPILPPVHRAEQHLLLIGSLNERL